MEPNEPKGAPARRPIDVSIVVFPECDPCIIYGVYDTLYAPGIFLNRMEGREEQPLFRPRLVAAGEGPIELCTGVTVMPHESVADVKQADIVFVPNVMVYGPECIRNLDRRLIGWIREMHERGAQVMASCGGPIVLAEAGLLDGHAATTHWSYVSLLRSEFPNVEVQENRILVHSGPGHSVVCSGGSSSWQDLCLYMIARHGGIAEALRMSKLFLYQWHRDGQQPYASMIANVGHEDAAIRRCQAWLADHYHHLDPIREAAAISGLPKRTFDRRFRAATGYAPLAYVQSLRIEEAKQMLETSEDSVEEIARAVGYEDTASFRRLFRRLVGMIPSDYRRKFQVPAGILAPGPEPSLQPLVS
jgi:transcriptional regulator GlxA family with amidase domain